METKITSWNIRENKLAIEEAARVSNRISKDSKDKEQPIY